MKQKDLAMIIVVVAISGVLATVASGFILNMTGGKEQTAEVVDPITSAFTQPDTSYFNEESVDPTEIIRIGDNSNQTPFTQPQ